ncbi:MAG TPA: VCBS repeat-containing protein [Pyrinomonadaceae bacterium]|nr:VCBS repeat-containing protein [Pyrinomonadaceae bacterium]
MLALVALITIISSQAVGQVCTTNRHFPNYLASVDGYAPADYDGDGLADWSIKDFSGAWTIDYSSNGFNGYDQTFFGYGGQTNLPVPADYDGDGLADLAVKSHSQGSWNIDYAANGFGSWDASYFGYGGSQNWPVPADYDGDGRADLSVKSSTQGTWSIDYAANGFGAWDATYFGYGGADNIPVPAQYDNFDVKADLAVWTASGGSQGNFNIDWSFNGSGSWDVSHNGILPQAGRPAAGDFNGDGYVDFSVKGDDGVWRIILNQSV